MLRSHADVEHQGDARWARYARLWWLTCLGLAAFVIIVAIIAPAVADARAANPARPMKLELLDAMQQPPGVVWYGSSSSRNIDPELLRELTGSPGFNASLTAATPYDFDYYTTHMAKRWGKRMPHIVWGMDVELFRERELRVIMPRRRGATPPATENYTGHGMLRRDPYAGTRLEQRLEPTVKIMVEDVYSGAYEGLGADERRYFESALRTANEHGVTPTLVIMPVHQRAAEVLGPIGRDDRRREIRQYLRGLKDEGVAFRLLEVSNVRSIGGHPDGFYDAGHLRPETSDLLVRHLHRTGLLKPVAPEEVLSGARDVQPTPAPPPKQQAPAPSEPAPAAPPALGERGAGEPTWWAPAALLAALLLGMAGISWARRRHGHMR